MIQTPGVAPGNRHVWHLYVVRVSNRDAVVEALHERGIGSGIHYPTPLHLEAAFRELGGCRGDFPVAERAADEILSLPIYPGITQAGQERTAEALIQAVRLSCRRAPPRAAFIHQNALCQAEHVGTGTRIWAFAHVMAVAHAVRASTATSATTHSSRPGRWSGTVSP